MNYCYISSQIAEYAHWLGKEMEEEIAIEKLMMEKLRMANLYLKALGKRHCRHGVKPVIEKKSYLNGYSNQYARENQYFNAPF